MRAEDRGGGPQPGAASHPKDRLHRHDPTVCADYSRGGRQGASADYTAYRGPDGRPLNEYHAKMLAASAITAEHAQARGYETIVYRRRLGELGIVKAARNCVPGLLVPMLRIDGSTWGYQYRPDVPRWRQDRIVKYETPYQQRNGVDVPPGVADWLGDPSVPLWVTEGVKKADCGAHYGLCIVALPGVWSWMGTNTAGGKVALPDWRDIALNNRRVILAFDGDVARKESVQKALHALADYLAIEGANVEYLWLPDTDGKTGLDDYLVDDHTVDDLLRLVKPDPPPVATETPGDTGGDRQPPESEPEPVQPISLDDAHEVFRRWFGNSYDTDALDITLGKTTDISGSRVGEGVERADVRLFLDAVFGDDTGIVVFALGMNPRRNPNSGKYQHDHWSERNGQKIACAWPGEAEQICDAIEQYACVADLYIVPYLRRSRARAKGDAVILRVVHTDADRGLDQEKIAKLTELGAFVIGSGSPGNGHVYVPLSEPVSQAEHEALCKGLIEYLDGDKAKHSDNDLLRPVGAYNLKSTVFEDVPARQVHWLIKPNGTRVDKHTLAVLLGVDLAAGEEKAETGGRAKAKSHHQQEAPQPFDLKKFPKVGEANGQQPHDGEPINLALDPKVRKALETRTVRLDGTGDRSVDAYRVLCACVDAGLTEAQAEGVLRRRGDLADWLDENPAGELDRTWAKIEQQREEEADDAQPHGDLEQSVSAELNKLRVREEAKRRLAAEKQDHALPFDAGLLGAILDRPAEPPFRIDGLLPSEGAMLVVAQRKTGKTTLVLNLAHSLITGQMFLGKFGVRTLAGRVAILNFEVSGTQLARWADQVDIQKDRLLLVNLRGRRNPLSHPDDRARLAALLKDHQVESVIVDPFARAYSGTSQNDPGEVSAWLADLDQFARSEVGAVDLILTTHTGWNQERTRGSSALEDWADSIVTMTRGSDKDEDTRYLRAIGRDVCLDEDQLHFDPQTRLLSLTGSGSRKQTRNKSKAESLVNPVVLYVQKHEGASTTDIIAGVRKLVVDRKLDLPFQDADVRTAAKLAAEQGLILRNEGGSGKPTKHYPVEPTTADSNVDGSSEVRAQEEERSS